MKTIRNFWLLAFAVTAICGLYLLGVKMVMIAARFL